MKLQRELPLTGVGDEKRLIPLGDENPREKVPVVNYAIISANLLVFLFSISSGRYGEIVMKYGFIPEKFFRGENLFTLGIGASITHALLTGSPDIPSIGSSGAISGVIGAYFLLYPRARVYVLFFIFFQLLFGIISVIKPLFGIAYWAHVGGFLIGLAVGTFLKLKNNERKRRKSEFSSTISRDTSSCSFLSFQLWLLQDLFQERLPMTDNISSRQLALHVLAPISPHIDMAKSFGL